VEVKSQVDIRPHLTFSSVTPECSIINMAPTRSQREL
jgi:hypothetical protein